MKEEYLHAEDIQFKHDFNERDVERYFSGINSIKAKLYCRIPFLKNSHFLKSYQEDKRAYVLYQRLKTGINDKSIYNLTYLFQSAKLKFETIDKDKNVHCHDLPLEKCIDEKSSLYGQTDCLLEDARWFYNVEVKNVRLRLCYVKRNGRRVFVEPSIPYSTKGSNIFFTDTTISKEELDILSIPLRDRKLIKYFYDKIGADYMEAPSDLKHGVLKKTTGSDGLEYFLYGKGTTFVTMQLDTLEIGEDEILSK